MLLEPCNSREVLKADIELFTSNMEKLTKDTRTLTWPQETCLKDHSLEAATSVDGVQPQPP